MTWPLDAVDKFDAFISAPSRISPAAAARSYRKRETIHGTSLLQRAKIEQTKKRKSEAGRQAGTQTGQASMRDHLAGAGGLTSAAHSCSRMPGMIAAACMGIKPTERGHCNHGSIGESVQTSRKKFCRAPALHTI